MSQIVQVSLATSAIIGAATALGFALRWLWRFLRQASRMVDALMGEPAGLGSAGRPSILDRMASLEAGQSAIEEFVRPLSPRLDGLESRLAAVEARLPEPAEEVR